MKIAVVEQSHPELQTSLLLSGNMTVTLYDLYHVSNCHMYFFDQGRLEDRKKKLDFCEFRGNSGSVTSRENTEVRLCGKLMKKIIKSGHASPLK